MVSLPLLVAFTLLASLSVHFTSVLSIGFIVIYSFAVGLGCGLSSPLLLGISLHGHADLAGTGSALQGALKMAGAALVLWFFASGRTGTASGLLSGLFLLSHSHNSGLHSQSISNHPPTEISRSKTWTLALQDDKRWCVPQAAG